MSQFNFPRINFSGEILLDTPTANNGKFTPLMIFNQNEALPYLPPCVYLTPAQVTYVQSTLHLTVVTDSSGSYVQIATINTGDLFTQWATVPLGQSNLDTAYWPLYNYIPRTDGPGMLAGNIPGYWNYFGDLSVTLQNVMVTGVQLPAESNGVNTWTPNNQVGCPPALAQLFGGSLSFASELTNPNSRSTAVFCDVDSEGQTCTQIFYGQAGMVNTNTQQTFFSGSPCKSTANWMNLSKVLNWSDPFLIPMGGSATFYSTIQMDSCDGGLQTLFNQYAGETVNNLFMRLHIHRVHEVRNPNYSKMPTTPVGSNNANVPKNPARAYVTGSICPWVTGDMKTNSICRILKNHDLVNIDNTNIPVPPTQGGQPVLSVPTQINLGPVFLNYDLQKNLFSLDIINTIAEYGTTLGTTPNYAGNGDVPFFTAFESYNFGKMDLYWRKDGSPLAMLIGSFDFNNNYNMQQLTATGGLIDIAPFFFNTYSLGTFYISINNTEILSEENIFIATDQQGTYAEQNQTPANLYLSDGLPLVPITMRAFYRGQPIQENNKANVIVQAISVVGGSVNNTSIQIYDGMPFTYPVNVDGCMCYGFVSENLGDSLKSDFSNIFWYFANTFMLTNRVLNADTNLLPYINGTTPLTWDVVYNNVFKEYHTILPIMNAVQPFTQANWSDPNWLARMLQVIDLQNWNAPRYMPVTRELSANQRALLQKWAAICMSA